MGVEVPGAEGAGDDELELGEGVAGEGYEGHARAGPNPGLGVVGDADDDEQTRTLDEQKTLAAVVSNKSLKITCQPTPTEMEYAK